MEIEWKALEILHNNGKLEQIGNFKNGKLEGEFKSYHNNGKLEEFKLSFGLNFRDF